MSHAIYTEERAVKINFSFYFSIAIFITGTILGSLVQYYSYFPVLIGSSLLLLLMRDSELIRNLNKLSTEGKISFTPKRSIQIRKSRNGLIFFTTIIFLPLFLAFLLPVPINLTSALGLVFSWPLSTIEEAILIKEIEKKNRKRIYAFTEWIEVIDGIYIKEYGYVLKD
ncbi:hypothetical protein [Acidianus sp. RZ1]|uniref:hypothetical protein n=1 Tax=Acidianus sp. RZ1 TaxID=1540082 RepID=UPI001490AD9F|nr:hypothetical protein [Acidianus sp. RZ1]NON61310.1 hypothetical protein [Acidianus sp. RZ1]